MDKYLGTMYNKYILHYDLQVQRSNHTESLVWRQDVTSSTRLAMWATGSSQSTLNSSIQLVPKH